MKRAWLLSAAGMVLVANGFALIHAWRNRLGDAEADLVLTQRELPQPSTFDEEDSDITLHLSWEVPHWGTYYGAPHAAWLDEKALRELGFDTRVLPSDAKAVEFYARQRARRAFIALEYDGRAWIQYAEEAEREAQKHGSSSPERDTASHLVAIDASSDATQLRLRHPDRRSVIIVPAVIRIVVETFAPANHEDPARPAVLLGAVQEIPASIHVPKPFSDAFRNLSRNSRAGKYQAHLRYGSSLEPWVLGIEFLKP